MSEISYFQTRASHEDDRFSGFASQSDLTFSYGRDLLVNRGDMSLSVVGGIGVRWTRFNDGSDSDEPILRFAGEYEWTLSDSAVFNQELSMEAGSDSDIYRSESSIETDIMENLSLRFSFNIKHQTAVPVGKKKTDTQTAVTFVMNF
jgi:putative salt-induced outer membrane protein